MVEKEGHQGDNQPWRTVFRPHDQNHVTEISGQIPGVSMISHGGAA